MKNKFNDFIENLQKEIIKKEIEDHNEKIVNLFYNPYNWVKPPQKEITVYNELRGGKKGYFLGIYLKIENGVIIKANFITDGCGVMIATGSQTMMLIEGKKMQFAEKLVADPAVFWVLDITGRYDAEVLARFHTKRQLDNFIKTVQHDPSVEETNTRIILNIYREMEVR